MKVNRHGGGEGTAVMGFTSGQSTNLTTVAALDDNGRISIFSSKATDVVIDVVDYHTSPEGTSGTVFVPVTPARVAKTATGEGTCDPAPCDRLAAGETVAFQVAGVGGVPTDGAAAVVVSVTIENPSGAGWAKVNPNAGDWSAAAILHYQSAQSVNDVVVARLDEAGAIDVWTQDPADVTIDVAGYYSPLSATWSYAYDGDGLRRARTAPSGEVTSFTWDPTEGVPALLTETTGAETTAWVYGPGGSPLIQHGPDGTVTFLHADQLGSVRVLTDEGGDVVGSQAFDPYGNPTERSGIATPFGYAGEYTDDETGLQYLRARFYDPTTGQFLSRDPIEPLTRSAYAYVGGNPLNLVDPRGLAPWDGVVDWVSDHRHEIIDVATTVGTGIAVAAACSTGVGCVLTMAAGATVGAGAHIGSDALIDDGNDISVLSALGHGGLSAAAGAGCALLFGQGCGVATAGRTSAAGVGRESLPLAVQWMYRTDRAVNAGRGLTAFLSFELWSWKTLLGAGFRDDNC